METTVMVYCPKCGAENTEDTKFCIKCGAALYPERRGRREKDTCFGPREQRVEDECFGIPHGGAIAGIVFGAIILLIGVSIAFGQDIGTWIGPFILIVLGLLVVIGALFRYRRRYES